MSALRPGVETERAFPIGATASGSVRLAQSGSACADFHDNGLAPDTNFVIDLRLRFELVWSSTLTEAGGKKTLVAILDDLNVGHDWRSGIGSDLCIG